MGFFWSRRHWLLTLLFLALIGGNRVTRAGQFDFKAGLGYDFFSQEYFVDSAALAGPDSFFTNWSLTNTYFDDQKYFAAISYYPGQNRRSELSGRYELSDDLGRLKLSARWRRPLKLSRLDLNYGIDWRHRFHAADSGDIASGYFYGSASNKLTIPFSNTANSTWQFQGETVQFESEDNFNYSYLRFGGKVGLDKAFDNFSYGDFRLFYFNRQVPDSSLLGYHSFGIEQSFFGFHTSGEFDYLALIEWKNYSREKHRDDYFRGQLTGQNKVRFTQGLFSAQEVDFDLFSYSDQDPVNRDYLLLQLAALTGYENEKLRLALGPGFAYLDQKDGGDEPAEDYFEVGGKVDFDLLLIDHLFLSVQSVVGFRDQKNNSEILTDYSFERLSALGDVKIFRTINLSFLFSTEWEWHEIETNDAATYFVSSTLSAGF